jgi:hypothetical protein
MRRDGALSKRDSARQTNMDWFDYYVERFNKTQNEDAAILAMLYLFRALRDGETT